MLRSLLFSLSFVLVVSSASAGVAVELTGSRASMERQHRIALQEGLTFARTAADIERMVMLGQLVELHGDENYDVLPGIRSNAARHEVRTFVERLAAEYHEATGEKLVVTSLTRPSGNQPWNASPLSVHPAGISVDLRVSQRAASRQWLESRLLEKEAMGLLDVTREFRPPHYHIAIFPSAYMAHVEVEEEARLARLASAIPETEREVLTLATVIVDAEDEPRRTFWSRLVTLFGLLG